MAGINLAALLAKSGRLGGETNVAKVAEKLNTAAVKKTGMDLAALLAKNKSIAVTSAPSDPNLSQAHAKPKAEAEACPAFDPDLADAKDQADYEDYQAATTRLTKSIRDDIGEAGLTFTPKINDITAAVSSTIPDSAMGMDGNIITYSPRQQEVITSAMTGESLVVIGPAGSGKTTTSRGAIQAILDNRHLPRLPAGHKYIPEGTPGALICAFTRRSVNNIRKVTPTSLKNCCITVHKALEYEPVVEWDDDKGKEVKRFKPRRNKLNPLPAEIRIVVIEEAGMLSVDLFKLFYDALPNPELVQFIYLGDLFQLPPPMGDAILGYKMLEHKVVELDRVYRTDTEDSPITSLAWDIKDGKIIPANSRPDPKNPMRKIFPHFEDIKEKSKGIVDIRAWQNPLTPYSCNQTAAAFMIREFDEGRYDVDEDIILVPFEKAHSKYSHEELVSTININILIADVLSKRRNAVVHEIIARGQKYYYAVGDKVLVDKEDGIIEDIRVNPKYIGEVPQAAAVTLSRSGVNSAGMEYMDSGEIDIDTILESMATNEDDVTNAASHIITVRFGDWTREITQAGQISGMLLGYAITVYKAQGSEWRNVYGIIHKSHAAALVNEMLYTMVTRAKSSVTILCEPDTFKKGVQSRKIKGKTLEEKSQFFRAKTKEQQASEEVAMIAAIKSGGLGKVDLSKLNFGGK